MATGSGIGPGAEAWNPGGHYQQRSDPDWKSVKQVLLAAQSRWMAHLRNPESSERKTAAARAALDLIDDMLNLENKTQKLKGVEKTITYDL